MKGHEIINHIVREEMPDMEKVRKNCHREFASERASSSIRFRRLAPIAVAVALIFAMSTTVFALGGFDWFIQRFNPRFGNVVEPVMVYAEDEGIRITVIGVQNFETMTIIYLSVQELTEQNRLYEDMDWWPGLHLHVEGAGSGGMAQKLLYFDDVTSTAYLEIRLTSSEAIPEPLTISVNMLNLYPAEAIAGNWELVAYISGAASHHIATIAYEFYFCDVIVISRMILTPLGLFAEGTFYAPSDDNFMAPLQTWRDVYVETSSGLIPLAATGGGVNSYCRSLYDDEFEYNPYFNPTTTSVAEKIESHVDIVVRMDWETEYPIDVSEVTAIIINDQRILVP